MDKKKKWIIIIVAAIVIIGVGTYGGVHFTSQTGFCNSCHEMNTAYAGWQGGVHQDLHCYECHTDPGLINEAKIKANGLKEVYIHLTQEVNMEEVQADIPASRCQKCHDLTDKEKYGERVVNYHAQHQQFGFNECLTCHRPVGHTNEIFNGFKNEACAKCHTAPAKDKKPAAEQPAAAGQQPAAAGQQPAAAGDQKPGDSTGTSSKPAASDSSKPATSGSTGGTATAKPTLNLGHDLGATYANNCTTCHAGGAMLSPAPPHAIDASKANCSTCHTLKPKA